MHVLAEQTGFRLQTIVDYLPHWSLMGSELCKRGVPLQNAEYPRYFTRAQMNEFKREANAANAIGRGDSAAFILVRSG